MGKFDEFVALYEQTMDRLQAAPFWRLSRGYFEDLRQNLGDKLFLCVAEVGGELAAASLLTEVDGIVEYHLTGTSDAHRIASPSKLIINFATQWAKGRGNRCLHLTGGLRKGDSLHEFKIGFSPIEHSVCSWRIVLDPPAYEKLVERWEADHQCKADSPEEYFPAYRNTRPSPNDRDHDPRGVMQRSGIACRPSPIPDRAVTDDVTDSPSDAGPTGTVPPTTAGSMVPFFPISLEMGSSDLPWTAEPHTLWGSGRHALRALLAWGSRAQGWRRLLIPSYFCQDVVPAVKSEVDVAVYEHAPTELRPESCRGRRWRCRSRGCDLWDAPAHEIRGSPVVVEDHSHDPSSPWAASSSAHYAVASLRKTMPLPDGGVLWSPQGLAGHPRLL